MEAVVVGLQKERQEEEEEVGNLSGKVEVEGVEEGEEEEAPPHLHLHLLCWAWTEQEAEGNPWSAVGLTGAGEEAGCGRGAWRTVVRGSEEVQSVPVVAAVEDHL